MLLPTISVVLSNPLWVIITRIQTAKRKRPKGLYMVHQTAIQIIRNEGYWGFCHGLVYNLAMCIYPLIRQVSLELLLSLHGSAGHTATGLCGMAASCIATIITYPIHRLRVRRQAAVNDTKVGNCSYSCDGVVTKVFHSGVTGFIFFAVMSGSTELLDIALG